MKPIQLLIILLLAVIIGCRNEGSSSKDSISIAEDNTEAKVSEPTADEKEAEIDLGDLMKVMGGLMTGNMAQDSTEQGLFTPEGQLNVEFLKSEEGKPMRKVFADIAEVTEEEVDLSLTLMPDNDIVSVKHAEQIEKDLYNPQVTAYEESGKASGNFLELIAESRTTAKERTSDFKKKGLAGKTQFYKDNPTWFALDESVEDTYIDYRLNMVYLPLGDISFADSLVEFIPGKPKGRAPKGALGPAQGRLLTLKDCATLGIKGVLTLYFEDNSITDVNGPDIYVFEIGEIEPTNIEISKNGTDWINVGKIEGGTAGLDIHDFVQPGDTFNYIRLTDLDTYSGMPGADIDAVAAIGGALRMNLDSAVLFETGKHELKEEGILAIKELATQMKNLHKGTITVEGHTDDVGSDATNKTLSQKRAASVATALKKAINKPAFKWKELGYGESRPLVENTTDENRAKNRRVEILVMPF